MHGQLGNPDSGAKRSTARITRFRSDVPDKGTADSEQAEAQIEAQQDDSDAKLTAHVLLEQMGSLGGLIYSSLPVLVFVPISSSSG